MLILLSFLSFLLFFASHVTFLASVEKRKESVLFPHRSIGDTAQKMSSCLAMVNKEGRPSLKPQTAGSLESFKLYVTHSLSKGYSSVEKAG